MCKKNRSWEIGSFICPNCKKQCHTRHNRFPKCYHCGAALKITRINSPVSVEIRRTKKRTQQKVCCWYICRPALSRAAFFTKSKFYDKLRKTRPYRLVVRTSGSQPGNTGSTPVRATAIKLTGIPPRPRSIVQNCRSIIYEHKKGCHFIYFMDYCCKLFCSFGTQQV